MQIYLAKTQGFCAGVAYAIDIVEKALEKYGSPLYVYHEIVHNTYVVDNFKKKGVVFVEEIKDVPEGEHIIFSAHGVPPSIIDEAKKRKLLKDIQKILKKHKFKFLNVKVEEAQPALAKFFYQIYRVIAVPSSLLSGQESSPALKYLFIDSVLSEKQKTLISRLHKDNIEKRLAKGDSSEVEQIKKELAVLLKSISDEQKGDIARFYRQYLVFLKLLKFDYYFFLRKF